MTANERDLRVVVVHGCFPERSDSILSVFSWEPLRAKLSENDFLWLANYPARACAARGKAIGLSVCCCEKRPDLEFWAPG